MSELFGTKYFGFIASSYGITALVLLIMVVWVIVNQRRFRRQLAEMEALGYSRVKAAKSGTVDGE